MLDQYREVTFDDERQRVTAQAGCHLGVDPYDPAGTSSSENSLLQQLERKGWALPNLGGITHQTISGFLSTGSSGGSTIHSLQDSIVGIRLVDGTGRIREFTRRSGDDRFFGAGLSLGLLGIISTITLQCEERYDIIGEEATTTEEDCEIDLFGDSSQSLRSFLEHTDYSRLLWWPQSGVRKVVVWKARRMRADDYDETTSPGGRFRPKRYTAFGTFSRTKQRIAGLIFTIIGNPEKAGYLSRYIERCTPHVLPKIINFFVPANKGKPQIFWDYWWQGLPMDDEVDDDLIPTEFTEMWVPIERTQDVMAALRDHYREGGWQATGTYLCEIYAAKASDMWISPAFERNVLRIDIFWFARNSNNPESTYYPQFWKLLQGFGCRFHWGKNLPLEPTLPNYLESQYPRWSDFMRLRAELDPDQVFVSDYWRRRLGIVER